MISSSSDDNPVAALAEEFLERYRRGERPALGEYTQKYPDLAEEIRDLFPALVMMEDVRPAGDGTGAYESGPEVAGGKKLERLGDYRILREVGRGGMGIVYEAEQESLGRHVALKVLPAHTLLDPRRLRRFQREARAAAGMHHTNIVPVYGVGEHDGLHYYVMQFIQGQSLGEVLAELKRLRLHKQPTMDQPFAAKSSTPADRAGGDISAADVAQALLTGQFGTAPAGTASSASASNDKKNSEAAAPSHATPVKLAGSSSAVALPGQGEHSALTDSGRHYWQSVASIGMQVADALAYAHAQGTLHRDIKPSNLLLDTKGTVWVTDFGLAKAADSDDLTDTGDIVGTVRYMAPERFQGHADPRSDVYSLGLTLFELLTLGPAFPGSDRNKLIDQVKHEEPTRPRKLNADVPRDMETIVLKAISKDPAHRYQTAAELGEDLKRFVDDKPIQARRTRASERLWRWCRRNPALAGLTTAVAVLLLAVAVGATMTAIHFRHMADQEHTLKTRAENKAEESRQRLVRLNVERGVRLMDTADLAGAAVVFAEALHLDQGQPDAEAAHRERLGSVLGGSPRPTFAWLHPGAVRHAEFSPDGRLVVTASEGKNDKEGETRIWDAGTGKPLTDPYKHQGWAYRASFSPDGKRVVSASLDGTVVVLDANTGAAVFPPFQHPQSVLDAVYSPDGSWIVTVCGPRLRRGEGEWRVYHADTGKLLGQAHKEAGVHHAAFSPDSKTLVTRATEMPKVYDVALGKLLTTLPTDQLGGFSVFSRDGNHLATNGLLAQVWETASWKNVSATRMQNGYVSHIAFSPDGRLLATASWDHTARLWETHSGKAVHTLKHHGNVNWVSFSPDGRRLLTACFDGTARIWDVGSGALVVPPLSHGELVDMATFSPDGRRVLTTSHDGTARIWDLAAGEPAPRLFRHDLIFTRADFSPDGRRVLTFGNGTVRVWDAASGKVLAERQDATDVRNAEFSHDGRLVLVRISKTLPAKADKSVEEGEVRFLDPSTLANAANPITIAGPLRFAALSRDNRLVLTASWINPGVRFGAWNVPAQIRVHEVATGKEAMPGPLKLKGVMNRAEFHPDGKSFVTHGYEDPVQIWEVATGKELHLLKHARTNHASFSPIGDYLVTSGGYQAGLWETASGKKLASLKHAGIVMQAWFSSNGKQVVTASLDNSARVWQVPSGLPVTPPMKHSGFVPWARFSDDGRRVVTASADRTARVWDARTGDPLSLPLLHGDAVGYARFSADGRRLLTAVSPMYSLSNSRYPIGGGEARLWDLAPETRTVAELTPLAQWLAGRRLTPNGDFASLETEPLARIWMDLHDKYPGLFASTARQVRSWHEREAADSELVGNWTAATFHLDRLIELEPAPASLFHRRGHAHAELKHWGKAARDYAKAAALDRTHSVVRHRHALLSLKEGDANAFRLLCKLILDDQGRIRGPLPDDQSLRDPEPERSAVWTCVLAPDALSDPHAAVKLARQVLARDPKNSDYQLTLGAALIRANEVEAGMKILEAVLQSKEQPGIPHTWLFLALGHAQRKQPAQAKKWFDQATPWIEEAEKKRKDSSSLNFLTASSSDRRKSQLLTWDELFEVQLLHREAARLILAKEPPKPRN